MGIREPASLAILPQPLLSGRGYCPVVCLCHKAPGKLVCLASVGVLPGTHRCFDRTLESNTPLTRLITVGEISRLHSLERWPEAMIGMKVSIVRYISDDPQPGIVECQFEDAYGRRWSFVEKTLVVSAELLDAHSVYPQPGVAACNIVQRFPDAAGRKLIRINAVESVEGVTQFDVLPEMLVE